MMNKIRRDISIIAVGDRVDHDSYQKFAHEKKSFLNYGFEYVATDYRRFLKGKIPQIKTKKIIIFLFFPFSYWNKNIEHKNYKGIYGNSTFYRKSVIFWDRVEQAARKHLSDKKIVFINNPQLCGAYRDKLAVIKKLTAAGISQPRLYVLSSVEAIQKKLTHGISFFLKPRYGSMGKGITFLTKSDWQTNFTFKNNKIISRRSDHGWKFSDVTGKHKFLKQLLKKDILIQEAVGPGILNGNMIDFRVYTFRNKVVYIYPRKNKLARITTNISQGGHGDPGILKMLPKSLIARVEKEAVKASRALNIDFAGIDIIPDRNFKQIYVVDVNVFSGFPKRRTFNLARCLTEELRKGKRVLDIAST